MRQLLHATQFSIIEHLRTVAVLTDIVWHYGGMQLDEALPFASVEHLNTGATTLDKRSTHQALEYNFQIGLYARNASELAKLQDVLTAKLAGEIPLYNTDGALPVLTEDTVRTAVLNVVPMPVDTLEGISGYHRCYFDVQAYVILKIN